MSERNNEIMNNEVETNAEGTYTAIKYGSVTWPLPEQDGVAWTIEDIIQAAKHLSATSSHPITDQTPYIVGEGGVVTFVKPTQSAGTKGISA